VEQFAQLLVSGIALGAVYALLALGFVVVFKATEVVNFAHPGLVMVGTFTTARIAGDRGVPFVAALALGAAVAGLVAVVAERLVVRRVASGSLIAAALATIGLDIIIQTEVTRRIGIDVLPVGDPWGSRTVDLFGITIPQTRVAALLTGVAVLGVFFLWLRRSEWGLAMRAAADDHHTAELMGVRLGRLRTVTWIVAAVLATLAGVFLAMFPAPGVSSTTSNVAFRAFPAAILGGLDSPGGALVGGLLIGVTESLAQGYQEELSFLGDGAYTVMPYAVMVAVLLVRPTGLFGQREVSRV
jgi:branched-chain amino acid transport system permease protein